MSSTRNNHHAKNSLHNHSSPIHHPTSLSDHSDVYDHLYTVSKPIHITVYRNGDQYDSGTPIPVTRAQFKNWLTFLDYLTDRLQLTEGAVHNVYTVHGEEVRHFKQLKQGGHYVGAKGEFKHTEYGGKDTHRTKWQIRNPSAKPDPTTVMSKESRELYLEQKGFKPVLDDVWDDKMFDKKNPKHPNHPNQHHSPTKTHHETVHKNHVGNHNAQQKSISNSPNVHNQNGKNQLHQKHLQGNTKVHPAKHQAIPHYMTSKTSQPKNSNVNASPINKKEMKDHAYRIKDEKAHVKSRFPPIHSGSLVEMNKKTKNEKEPKSLKTRSNSAPEGLHNKQGHQKKPEPHQGSKTHVSETKGVYSTQKKDSPAHHTIGNKNHSSKPPDGKNHDAKKSGTNSLNTNHNSPSNSEEHRQSRPKSRNNNQANQSKHKSEDIRDRVGTPANLNNKRRKSLEPGSSTHQSNKHSTTRRRTTSYEDYPDQNLPYADDRDHYYDEEQYDKHHDYEYEHENNRHRIPEDDYYHDERNYDEYDLEREYEHNRHKERSSHQHNSYESPEYEREKQDHYHEQADHYYEPEYEENEEYLTEYHRSPSPKQQSRHTKSESDPVFSPLNYDEKNSAKVSTPRWANELTVAVRELAAEVHHLAENRRSF